MEQLAELLGMGASVASGGIFGAIGAMIGQWSQYKQKQQDNLFKEKEWMHEKDLIVLQQKGQALETELQLDISHSEGSWRGLEASINADAALAKESYKWVNAIKSLFRPFLTTALWFLAGFVFIETVGLEELTDIQEYMIYTVFFTASSATAWWFGDRTNTPKFLKNL